MDANRRSYAAWMSLATSTLLLASALVATAPGAWAGSIRPGDEPVQDITVTTRTRASWYGTGFHGKASASGRVFNQTARTAAHRTLPFGTRVEVTNLRNGRRLTVVVTDRGPYIPGRGLDVSAGAASSLGFRDRGVAAVRMSIRVPRTHGLTLVGPSSMYILWVPPRRGSLATGPLLLTEREGESRMAPGVELARRELAVPDELRVW